MKNEKTYIYYSRSNYCTMPYTSNSMYTNLYPALPISTILYITFFSMVNQFNVVIIFIIYLTRLVIQRVCYVPPVNITINNIKHTPVNIFKKINVYKSYNCALKGTHLVCKSTNNVRYRLGGCTHNNPLKRFAFCSLSLIKKQRHLTFKY